MKMKSFLPAVLALSLGGCASVENFISEVKTALTVGTASASNPVTPERLSQIEAAETLVFTGLNAWKKSCTEGLINANCKEQIEAVQVYTRQIPPYQLQLRQFVKANSQVNAIVLYNTISSLIANAKTTAAKAGVALGG